MRFSSCERGVFRASLLVGASASALLIASPAFAQAAAQPQPATPPAEQVPPTDDQAQADQTAPVAEVSSGDTAVTQSQGSIVITGSRIRQPEFTSPDPVSRIDPEIAQRQGKLEIAETLQSSPIAAGSTQITSAISSNFNTNGGPGAETIDLRGLGANRTLVLLNGRRAGPAGTRGGVSSFDLNVLPQSIVKSVDILKTGASSIYGSDAIAGVVNLITKNDFNGLQVDAFGNLTTRGGGEQYSASVLWGKTFDRGHVMIAADYFHQNELARGDRGYLGCPEAYIFKKGSNQRADLIDPRTGKPQCLDLPVGQVWTYDLEYLFGYGPGNLRLADGTPISPLPGGGGVTLIQYQYPGEHLGVPGFGGCGDVSCFGTPPGWFPTGYDPASYAIQNNFSEIPLEQSLIPKTSRYTIYGDASYELSDHVEAYAEFLGNRRKTYQNGWRQVWAFGGTEDFYGTYWAPGWEGFNWISPTAITNHADNSQKVDYWRGVGGLRGDLGGFLKGWSYDAYVQYSHNKGIYKSEQFLQDIYDVSSFQYGSCVGTKLPRSGKACMDVPWTDPNFLMGDMSPALQDYMFDWETGKTIYKQLSGEASMTGNLFELPAGPVGVALGVASRRDSIVDTPGDITLAGNAWGSTASGITAGHTQTNEAFGEIQVPLLKDRPFFRDLSLSGAARITNVKAVRRDDGLTEKDNGNWTYKVGGNWAVNSVVRFRGTYGTSYRAPALFEEFKANETGFISARTIDPCVRWGVNLDQGNISQRVADNCAADGIPNNYAGGSITATVFSQGGIGSLSPETSTAKTASIILTPHFAFLPKTRLSLAIDYFDIKVKGEISQLGAGNIISGCYESETFPSDPLCSLFTRGQGLDPYGIGEVHDKYVNIASQRNQGLDFTALIQHNLGSMGTLTLLGNATYQLKDKFQLLPTSPTESFNGDIGDPKFVADLNATWRNRTGWSFFWGTEIYGTASNVKRFKDRHADSLCQTSVIFGEYCVHLKVPTRFYHSASVTKDFKNAGLEMTIGMRNIFDTKPPRVSTLGGSGLPSLIGPVVGTSQYDLLGRRIFINFSKKF
jgi:iron complex outermembrane receptor protein